jgi:transposase
MGALLGLFRWLDERVKELDRKLEDMAQRDEHREAVEIMDSVPGIGIRTAVAIEVELRDVVRFRKGSQLSSYLGVTPSERSSGQTTRKGSITHCGNPRLRDLFVESSWTLIRHDPEMRRTYERIRHQTGSGKKAIVAVARRLALRVRRMLLDKEPYHIERNKGSGDAGGGSSRPVVQTVSSVGAKRIVRAKRA